MFSQKQKQKIILSKSIYIIGRGPTVNYARTNKKNIAYITYRNNISNAININIKHIKKSKDKLIVGSIFFGLYTILSELDRFLKSKNIKKKIFLFGFDFRKFSTDEDFEKKIVHKPKPIIQQILDIGSQSFAFLNIKKKFNI